jgi:hypothetical protein
MFISFLKETIKIDIITYKTKKNAMLTCFYYENLNKTKEYVFYKVWLYHKILILNLQNLLSK